MSASEKNTSLEEIKSTILNMLSKNNSRNRNPENPLAQPLNLKDVVEPTDDKIVKDDLSQKSDKTLKAMPDITSQPTQILADKPISMTNTITPIASEKDIPEHLHESISMLQRNSSDTAMDSTFSSKQSVAQENQLANHVDHKDSITSMPANMESLSDSEPLMLEKESLTNNNIDSLASDKIDNQLSDSKLPDNENLKEGSNDFQTPSSLSVIQAKMSKRMDLASSFGTAVTSNNPFSAQNIPSADAGEDSSSTANSNMTELDKNFEEEAIKSNKANEDTTSALWDSNKGNRQLESPDRDPFAAGDSSFNPVSEGGLKNFKPSESTRVIPKEVVSAAKETLTSIKSNNNLNPSTSNNLSADGGSDLLLKQLRLKLAQSGLDSSSIGDLDSFIKKTLKETIKSWVEETMPKMVKEMAVKRRLS